MPKSRRPRQTASQEKYKREVKNLRNRVKRAEKAGFIFSPDIIPSVLNLPRRVAKAAIEAVKNIRDEILYKKAIGFSTAEKASHTDVSLLAGALSAAYRLCLLHHFG